MPNNYQNVPLLCRYAVMPLCRYAVMPLCRYAVAPLRLSIFFHKFNHFHISSITFELKKQNYFFLACIIEKA
jgi:hypothetical protein